MSELKEIEAIFKKQKRRQEKKIEKAESSDKFTQWHPIVYKRKEYIEYDEITLNEEKIALLFDKKGRFVGLRNWKD
jgi:hypothetical protein